MKDNIRQLREAIDKGLAEEGYMLEYIQQMYDLDYSCTVRHQFAPPEPRIEHLSYDGVRAACVAASLHAPTANTPEAIAAAHAELNRLSVRWQLDLALYLCTAAYNDLTWLKQQSVHGAGSVVSHGAAKEIDIILRPAALRVFVGDKDVGNKQLAYHTLKGGMLEASAIREVLVRTAWTLGELPPNCSDVGIPPELWYMPASEKLALAKRWDVHTILMSPENIREALFLKAIALRKAAFMEAVQGAWIEKPQMYLPGKRQPRPIETRAQATSDQAAAKGATQAAADCTWRRRCAECSTTYPSTHSCHPNWIRTF